MAVALVVAWAHVGRAQEPPTTTEQGSVTQPTPPPQASEPSPAPEAPAEAQTAENLAQEAGPGFWEAGGVKVTDGTILHPAATVGTSYQTNVFFKDPADGPDGVVGSAVLRVGIAATWGTVTPPRMEIESPAMEARQRLTFNLDLSLDWYQFLSSNPDVREVSDLAVGFVGGVAFNPGGALELDLRDGFVRNVTPGQQIREDADRDRNELTATGHYRPGGGALDIYGQYTFIIDVFESDIFAYTNRFSHIGTLGAKWQWLPRTQVLLEVSLGHVEPSTTDTKVPSTPFRAWAGISTLFTPVFALVARGGYGAGNYSSGEDIKTYLALVELRYAIGPAIKTALGYAHDFADALIGNFYVDHTFYGAFGMQLGGRWQVRARGEVRLRDYGGVKDENGLQYCGNAACAKTRSDVLPRVDVNLDYQVTPWLVAGLGYSFQGDSTDFFVRAANGVIDRSSYVWSEFLFKLGARW
jgi:hypothetical protein